MMATRHNVSSREDASSPLAAECGKQLQRTPSISRHHIQIAVNLFIITIPTSALSAALLALVFCYRIEHGQPLSESLRGNLTQNETDVYYVDINSSIILFVASWTSSLAPMLSGFILTLASFPIARQIFHAVLGDRTSDLPTPYQLALTLKFLDGSTIGAIWNWMLYLIRWNRRRVPQVPALTAASSVAILATVLGILVALADTWLHLTTTTVQFTQFSPSSDKANYSLGLVPRCLSFNNSLAVQWEKYTDYSDLCALNVAGDGIGYLINPAIAIKVLNQASNLATVQAYQAPNEPTPYTYLATPDTLSQPNRDYTAHTYGAATQCSLMSRQCSLSPTASWASFNCSGVWINDNMGEGGWLTMSFTDRTMTNTDTFRGAGNPYYYGAASTFGASGSPHLPNTVDFVNMLHGAIAFILGCNTTIYDVEYDRVNGSITRFMPIPSNTSTSNIWQTITMDISEGSYAMQKAIAMAAFSDTGQEFANKVAFALSETYLALGAEALERRPVLAAQDRHVSLVARIPAAPLTTLVVVNLLYVLCGLIFAAAALATARHEVPNIQARLTITGLIADRFEDRRAVTSTEDMFDEYTRKDSRRLAIELASEGSYEYTIRRRRLPVNAYSFQGSDYYHPRPHTA